jgi:hypothetical protein
MDAERSAQSPVALFELLARSTRTGFVAANLAAIAHERRVLLGFGCAAL